MIREASWLTRAAESLGAHLVPDTIGQERERARTRAIVCLAIASVWAIKSWYGQSLTGERWVVFALAVVYGSATFAYIHVPRRNGGSVVVLCATLILDPLLLFVVLLHDPSTFAFLYPFLLFVIVRSGIRYGVRSMYVSWCAALATSPLLLISAFWRSNLELTLSFVLLLAVVPTFFSPLIRRVHNVRAIEEERARFAAMHEVVVARSAFLAKVSHELRSPLQSIVSALDVFEMRHGHASSGDDELIARMRRSSLLLNTQLRDLLTLAKGEAGRLEMRPEPFEACALVESMADGARELAQAKGLELVVDLPSEPVFVVADGARIDQVLTNLVINSIRYTDTGQVRVSLHRHEPTSRRLRFSVADTGPGIPQEVLPTLFAPDKVMIGAERRGEGSGIGLAIVRTLLDHLGGTVAVTSGAGTGTTFTLEIPAEPVDAEVSDTVPSEPTGRILVVDDRDDVLDSIVSVIDELGFECDRAPSAAIGANLLAARRYDAVLLDIDMPVKSGAELAAETRRGNGPNRDTRLIGMSAAEVAQDTGAHFDACLTKPIDHAALRHALRGAAHGYRPSQPGLWA